MRLILAAILLSLLPLTAQAGEGLRALDTADSVRGLEGVGRLDIGGASGQRGFCTATLVSPTQVLTAAHCVFDPATGSPQPTEDMTFRAGLRHGEEEARRRVRRMVIDPGYRYGGSPTPGSVATDLALLELDRALELPQVRPFPASGRLATGDVVQVVSYARHRAEAASREDDCTVLARDARVLALSCSVDFGSSGAPVFVATASGLRIVSVISAKGVWDDRPAAFAVTVEAGLERLRREFARATNLAPVRKTLRVGEEGTGTIRFLRPGG